MYTKCAQCTECTQCIKSTQNGHNIHNIYTKSTQCTHCIKCTVSSTREDVHLTAKQILQAQALCFLSCYYNKICEAWNIGVRGKLIYAPKIQ